MMEKKNYTYYIGIDCGVNTGLCLWSCKDKKIANLDTVPIHRAMQAVETWCKYFKTVFVRIEDARLRKWIPQQKNEKWERGVREGAGSVKRDAKIWEDFLTDLGIPFELVPPKNNKTKVKANYFKKLTGYEGKTNEHSRDAAGLVIGM